MLHCFLLSKTLVLKIDKKTTLEGLDLGVRGALAEILCHESIGVNSSSIQVLVFILFPVASRILNHFRDSWLIPSQGIKTYQSNIFEFCFESFFRHGLGDHILCQLLRHGFINWTPKSKCCIVSY